MNTSVPASQGDDEAGVARELTGLTEMAQALHVEGGRRCTLQTVCELAIKVIDADHASITVGNGDGFRSLAMTSELPETVHRLQGEIGEGPWPEPTDGHATYVAHDLSSDGRWPRFAEAAVHHAGVHSLISSRLFAKDNQVAFINAFAHRRNAFSDSDVAIFGVFAAHASVALQAAEEQERADNLEIALRNSRRIGTAIGILMHGRRIDEASAFELLRRHSQHTNRKLADIADDVVRTGAL